MTSGRTKKEKINAGKARFSHDSFWKDLMEEYFYLLLKRILPELYEDADTEKKPRFLDKEFT
ncbi:MAG: hypothetical protein LBO21_01895, partial [Synergistaceae bacterium]|nr:hypothetical protein [Synergistaceae bacterium]